MQSHRWCLLLLQTGEFGSSVMDAAAAQAAGSAWGLGQAPMMTAQLGFTGERPAAACTALLLCAAAVARSGS